MVKYLAPITHSSWRACPTVWGNHWTGSFDPCIAEESFIENYGKRDIIVFRHNGASPQKVITSLGKYKKYTIADYQELPVMDYDAAKRYRDSIMNVELM
jgi:hypothetical protein